MRWVFNELGFIFVIMPSFELALIVQERPFEDFEPLFNPKAACLSLQRRCEVPSSSMGPDPDGSGPFWPTLQRGDSPNVVCVTPEYGLAALAAVQIPYLEQTVRSAGEIHRGQPGVPAHCPVHAAIVHLRNITALNSSHYVKKS